MPMAFLTLFRVATGENWNDLMESLSLEHTVTNYCINNPTYEDYVANGFNPIGCGSRLFATSYFFSYCFFVSIIFLNLFIAIILQGYFQTQDREK